LKWLAIASGFSSAALLRLHTGHYLNQCVLLPLSLSRKPRLSPSSLRYQINNGHTNFHFRRVLSMQNCYLTFVVLCTESLSRQSSDNSYSHFPIRGRYAGTCFERRIEYVRGEGECATETPCSASFKSLISDRLYLCKISLNFGLHTSYLMSSRQKRFREPTLNPPSMENALSASSLCLSRSVEQFLDESSPTGFQ